MKDTELKYFHPYNIEKKYNFKENLKKKDRFLEELLGKNEYFHDNDGSYGYRRNRKHLTLLQCSINDYLSDEFYNWERWFKNGRNIFSFSGELLEMLNHTDVKDITFESFHLPYDYFYISLKPLELKIYEDSDKIVEGVYVSIDHTTPIDPDDPDDYVIGFHFAGDFEEFIIKYHDKIWNDNGSGGESFWDYAFFFNRKRNVIKIIDAVNDWKEVYSKHLFQDDVTDEHLDLFNKYLKLVESTCMVLVNCLLYLSMPTEDKDIKQQHAEDLPFKFNRKVRFAKTKHELLKISDKISESGYSKISYVGNSFKGIRGKNLNAHKISPHWRRGHWRNQRFGENLINKMSKILNNAKDDPVFSKVSNK